MKDRDNHRNENYFLILLSFLLSFVPYGFLFSLYRPRQTWSKENNLFHNIALGCALFAQERHLEIIYNNDL